jgi:hypothetical protein
MFCILKSLLGQVPKKTKQVLVHTSYRSISHKRSKLWHEYPAHATPRRAKTFLLPTKKKTWKDFSFFIPAADSHQISEVDDIDLCKADKLSDIIIHIIRFIYRYRCT